MFGTVSLGGQTIVPEAAFYRNPNGFPPEAGGAGWGGGRLLERGTPARRSNPPFQKLLSKSDFNCCLCYKRLKVVMAPCTSL